MTAVVWPKNIELFCSESKGSFEFVEIIFFLFYKPRTDDFFYFFVVDEF